MAQPEFILLHRVADIRVCGRVEHDTTVVRQSGSGSTTWTVRETPAEILALSNGLPLIDVSAQVARIVAEFYRKYTVGNPTVAQLVADIDALLARQVARHEPRRQIRVREDENGW